MRKGMPSSAFHIRRGFALQAPVVLLAFLLSSSPLPAQFIVKPVNLAYLAQRADVIVQGRVTEVRHESLPGYPNIPTVVVTLRVETMLRGQAGKDTSFVKSF